MCGENRMWNRTENQIELFLIRHGKTRANLEQRYLGRNDEELSPEGKEELWAQKAAGNYPAPDEVDVVIVSPMKRCLQTAEILYPERTPLVIEEFREMDFGAFEGKNYKELQGDAGYQAWIDSNGILPFPGGEGQAEFEERCRVGLFRMIEQLGGMDTTKSTLRKSSLCSAKEPLRAAVIVHGGTIMALLGAYGELSYFDYQCGNGSGYRCLFSYRTDSAGKPLPESVTASDIRRF